VATKRATEQPAQESAGALSYNDELELRKARYSKVERETDEMGRVIGVRRLKLSEQTRLTAMTPDLGGVDEIPNPAIPGSTTLVPQRAQYFIVAMVCEINGSHIPFARTRGELDSVMDRLDTEGLKAASDASLRLIVGDDEGTPLEKAKNLSGMSSSE
jgi:hypothetical protein